MPRAQRDIETARGQTLQRVPSTSVDDVLESGQATVRKCDVPAVANHQGIGSRVFVLFAVRSGFAWHRFICTADWPVGYRVVFRRSSSKFLDEIPRIRSFLEWLA